MATTVTIYRLCVDGDMENSHSHPISFSSETQIPFPFFRIELFPIPSHSQLNGHIWVFMKIFLPAACLCWPATNSVRQIKESKRTNDQMNWQHTKHQMSTGKKDNQVILIYMCEVFAFSHSNVLIPIPMHLIPIPIPFPFYGGWCSNFRGNFMGPVGSRSFPFPCTSLPVTSWANH